MPLKTSIQSKDSCTAGLSREAMAEKQYIGAPTLYDLPTERSQRTTCMGKEGVSAQLRA